MKKIFSALLLFLMVSNTFAFVLENKIRGATEKGLPTDVEKLKSATDMNVGLKYDGYLIELTGTPIVQYKRDLELEIKALEDKYNQLSPLQKAGFSGRILSANISAKKRVIDSLIASQKQNIEKMHSAFLEDVRKTLKKSVKISKSTEKIGSDEIRVLREYSSLFNGFAIKATPEDIERIKRIKDVKAVYPNLILTIMLRESVPLINADDTWALLDDLGRQVTGEGVSIAVIDTGVDYTHKAFGSCTREQFLAGNCKKIPTGYDFVDDDYDPMDVHSHGTHVAATAAGKEDPNNNNVQDANEFWGVAPNATIYAYKVCSNNGFCLDSDVIAAVERAADPNQDGNTDDHVDVISMSLGTRPSMGGWPDNPLAQVVNRISNLGVTVVASAGNAGEPESIGSPSSAYMAISVGASDKGDGIAYFSSKGPAMFEGRKFGLQKPDVLAPGVEICAARWQGSSYETCFDSQHIVMSGTSMACPHVSGLVALILQKHPDWSPLEVKMALRNTAKKLGYNMQTQGYGRVDALAATSLAEAPPVALFEKIVFENYCLADLYGIASARAFKKYTIELGQGLNPSSWHKIFESSTGINSGVLLNDYNICTQSDGFYSFRLTVESVSGQKSEDIIYLNLDNIRLDVRDFLDFAGMIKAGENYLGKATVQIKGSAYAPNMKRFEVKWGKGKQPTTWSSDYITLSNNGLRPVFDSTLAVWDTRNINENGFYKLRLTVFDNNDRIIDDLNATVYIETTAKTGSPKQIAPIDSPRYFLLMRQPTIYDIDKDGKDEILFAYENKVYAYNEFLELEPGWPADIAQKGDFVVQNGPAVADIDKDGIVEIVVGEFFGKLDILQPDGKPKHGWPKQLISGEIGSVTLADLENDGLLEIIFADWDEKLHVFDLSGKERAGFPVVIKGLPQSLAVTDLDNDGKKEIVFETTPYRNFQKNMLYVIKSNGQPLAGWPKDLNSFCGGFTCRVAIGDLDGDKNLEIVATASHCLIYAWNNRGNVLPNFPVNIANSDFSNCGSTILANVDSDVMPEIIVAMGDWQNKIYAINHDGNLVEGWPVQILETIEQLYGVGELTMAGGERNIFAVNGASGCFGADHLCSFSVYYTDGNLVEGFPKKIPNYLEDAVPSFGDFDGDGNYEIIFVDFYNNAIVFDLPVKVQTKEWPVFACDSSHTNTYYSNVPYCNDGTVVQRCSNKKPFYCTATLQLIEKCSLCGCPSGHDCNAYTEKCVEWTDRCPDGTYLTKCSPKKPFYCTADRNLIQNCETCGCPSGKRCIDWNSEQRGQCIDIPLSCSGIAGYQNQQAEKDRPKCEATLMLLHEGQEEQRFLAENFLPAQPNTIVKCLEITSVDANIMIDGISARVKEKGFYKIGENEIYVEEIDYNPPNSTVSIYINGENEKNCPEDCNNVCLDSDYGANYLYRGALKKGSFFFKDYCSNGANGSPVFNSITKYLIEGVCISNNTYELKPFECPAGCLNGVCLQKNTCGNGVCDENLVLLGLEYPNNTKRFVDGSFVHNLELLAIYPSDAHILVDGIGVRVEQNKSYKIAGLDIFVDSIYDATQAGDFSYILLSVGPENQKTCKECLSCCLESDNGKNYIEKGFTLTRGYATFGYVDSCISTDGNKALESNKLKEYYCAGKTASSQEIQCDCYNGACLACKDGTLSGYCSAEKPYYCKSGSLVPKCQDCNCPSEKICNLSNGLCETKPDLTLETLSVNPETDEVTVTVLNQGESKTGPFYLEFWMDNIPKGTVWIESLDGTIGSGGSKLAKNKKTITQAFDHGLITGLHKVRVVADYSNMVQESDENNNTIIATLDFGKEVEICGDGRCSQQLVLLAAGETKSILYEKTPHTISCISISPGTAKIKFDDINKTIMQRYDYNINGVPIYVDSIATDWPEEGYSFVLLYLGVENPVNCPKDCNTQCDDSDLGKNYYERGMVKKGLFGYMDSCTEDGIKGIPSGSKIIENYCENNERKRIIWQCPYGCKNGACIRLLKD